MNYRINVNQTVYKKVMLKTVRTTFPMAWWVQAILIPIKPRQMKSHTKMFLVTTLATRQQIV